MSYISIYKEQGIYAIVNKISGMAYIGQTINNFGDRWDNHKALLRGNKHHNKSLQNDWNNLCEDDFDFRIIYKCNGNETQEDIDSLEESYIKEFKDNGIAYNISDNRKDMCKNITQEMRNRTGELNRLRLTGSKLSEETKKKMSETRKRKYAEMTDEERQASNEVFVKRMISSRSDWTDERRKQYSMSQWETPHGAKLSHEQVREIRRLYEQDGMKIADISKLLKINSSNVCNIVHYKRWAHLK